MATMYSTTRPLLLVQNVHKGCSFHQTLKQPWTQPTAQLGIHHVLQHEYSLWGLSPRPMAHKTIALTTELKEPVSSPRLRALPHRHSGRGSPQSRLHSGARYFLFVFPRLALSLSLTAIPCRMHRISFDLRS